MRSKEQILIWTSFAGSIASLTGLSVVSAARYVASSTEPRMLLSQGLVLGLVVLGWIGIAILLLLYMGAYRRLKLVGGEVFPDPDTRAKSSRAFAGETLRSLDIMAGDLSWLVGDLEVYRRLRERGVEIRVLTYTPGAPAIPTGKHLGIQFGSYPGNAAAPIKVSISDAGDESESRAFVVRRRTARRRSTRDEGYHYWAKIYYGSAEPPIINAMATLFELMWKARNPL